VHAITNEDILVLRHCEEHSIKLDRAIVIYGQLEV
jgi:hypothetical protein